MMKILHILVCATFVVTTSFSAYADFTVDRGTIRTWLPQDIVLTLGQDPAENPEVACLALTLGQFLRANDTNAITTPFSNRSRVNVTLFLRNDGVALADADIVDSVTDLCQTPEGPVSLKDNLEAFIAGNENNLVNCPICWSARFGMDVPDYGVLDPGAIPQLLLSADKVIDF